MMKKILLVTTKHSMFGNPTLKAFRALGCEVATVDYRDNVLLMPDGLIHRFFEKIPEKLKGRMRPYAQRRVDNKIISAAINFSPDLIFILKAKDISLDTLAELRKIAPTANWYSETMDHWSTISKIAPFYSHFFNFDPYLVGLLKKEGHPSAHYLPFCADISKNSLWPENDRPRNVTFIGSYHPTRYAEREYVFSVVKDLGLNLWGNKAWLNTSLRNYYHGYASASEIQNIYKSSKIVMNFYLTDVAGTGINLRPFEITAAGAMLLNYDMRQDVFNLFKSGEEFIPFSNKNDIREKVEYYLKHDEERLAIARAGFKRTLDEHTYLDRISRVLEIAGLSAA